MTDKPRKSAKMRVADLPRARPVTFDFVPDDTAVSKIATDLGLLALRKVRFAGALRPEGETEWRLEAHLGATVVQPCVVTLAPVTTRLEQDVRRRFVRDWPGSEAGEEIEMPEDESMDPLSDTIDIEAIMKEALALALPDYPRSNDAELEQSGFAPPGVEPITDEETRPFAGLADLKRKLEDGD